MDKKGRKPSFLDHARTGTTAKQGAVIYHSNQCPHTEKYVPIVEAAAKVAPNPFTTYSFCLDGQFVTNEILTENKFLSYVLN